ncbi:uncharacterized protein LOC135823558 [Sycon ciliatum]|uniref:uncharacterized protein LOC135823558 n=1 Tax=Sycon ciliatum TaxID=27933 RepID=UPI0020AE192F|eukprot:scpid27481/ scgid18564/ Ankyrin repeat domain-containing protein 12; Ankyrin repeat-containing cofactor 2; GAC-1 protein
MVGKDEGETKPLSSSPGPDVARGRFENTPLHLSVSQGDAPRIALILKEPSGQACLEQLGANLWTPLQEACFFGDDEVIGVLLSHGADVRTSDGLNGRTALHIAAQQGDADVIEKLLASCTLNMADKRQWIMQPDKNGDAAVDVANEPCRKAIESALASLPVTLAAPTTTRYESPRNARSKSLSDQGRSAKPIVSTAEFQDAGHGHGVPNVSSVGEWERGEFSLPGLASLDSETGGINADPESNTRATNALRASTCIVKKVNIDEIQDLDAVVDLKVKMSLRLAFEYNSKADCLKVRASKLCGLPILPSFIANGGHIYVRSTLLPAGSDGQDTKRKSDEWKIDLNKHAVSHANPGAALTLSDVSFKDPLHYKPIGRVSDVTRSIRISVCYRPDQWLAASEELAFTSLPVSSVVQKLMPCLYDLQARQGLVQQVKEFASQCPEDTGVSLQGRIYGISKSVNARMDINVAGEQLTASLSTCRDDDADHDAAGADTSPDRDTSDMATVSIPSAKQAGRGISASSMWEATSGFMRRLAPRSLGSVSSVIDEASASNLSVQHRSSRTVSLSTGMERKKAKTSAQSGHTVQSNAEQQAQAFPLHNCREKEANTSQQEPPAELKAGNPHPKLLPLGALRPKLHLFRDPASTGTVPNESSTTSVQGQGKAAKTSREQPRESVATGAEASTASKASRPAMPSNACDGQQKGKQHPNLLPLGAVPAKLHLFRRVDTEETTTREEPASGAILNPPVTERSQQKQDQDNPHRTLPTVGAFPTPAHLFRRPPTKRTASSEASTTSIQGRPREQSANQATVVPAHPFQVSSASTTHVTTAANESSLPARIPTAKPPTKLLDHCSSGGAHKSTPTSLFRVQAPVASLHDSTNTEGSKPSPTDNLLQQQRYKTTSESTAVELMPSKCKTSESSSLGKFNRSKSKSEYAAAAAVAMSSANSIDSSSASASVYRSTAAAAAPCDRLLCGAGTNSATLARPTQTMATHAGELLDTACTHGAALENIMTLPGTAEARDGARDVLDGTVQRKYADGTHMYTGVIAKKKTGTGTPRRSVIVSQQWRSTADAADTSSQSLTAGMQARPMKYRQTGKHQQTKTKDFTIDIPNNDKFQITASCTAEK